MKRRWMPAAVAAAVMVAGCGKPPPPQQGPGGDMAVSAVVAKAAIETVQDAVVLVATLDAKEQVTLVSELDATLTEIGFREGEEVEEGELLFRFDPTATRARLEEAEAGYRLAKLSYDRNQALLANETISQQEYDQAEANYHQRKAALELARDEWEKTKIEAPFAGVVGEHEVSVGQFVTRGQALTRLIRIDPLEIVFDVPERYLSKLKPGLAIEFTADAYPGEAFTGEIIYIAPVIDERTRTLRVKADVANPERRLKPGLYGELALVLERRSGAVVIPEACIQFSGDSPMVVMVTREGKSAFQPVTVGNRFEGRAEILEGLEGGDLVVVEGFQKMGPGMTVYAAPESERYGVAPGPLPPSTETARQDEARQGDDHAHL